MSGEPLLRSPIHGQHAAAGAVMGELAGWETPLSFGDELAEARLARTHAGVFDLSPLGRLRIRGDGALEVLSRLCTADVVHQEDDTALTTLVCDEAGGIVGLCRLLRLEGFWVLLTDPWAWRPVARRVSALAEDLGAKVDDQTDKTAMFVVVGPAAPRLLDAALPMKVSNLPEGLARLGTAVLARYIAVRSSLGGLWSLEVVLPDFFAGQAWRFVTGMPGEKKIGPCGAAAWEVLRIEAGLPCCGRDLGGGIDPFTAGLEHLVAWDHEFIGAEALARLRDAPPARRLVRLVLEAPGEDRPPAERIPQPGAVVCRPGGADVGAVSSAAFSPMLGKVVAFACLRAEHAAPDTELVVKTAHGERPARVMAPPPAP